jgi:hypothetical protein
MIYGCYLPVLHVNSTRIDLETIKKRLSGSKNAFSIIQREMHCTNCNQDTVDMHPVFGQTAGVNEHVIQVDNCKLILRIQNAMHGMQKH